MGTYTANYQLYMPSIGEQGWGDLMNGNLTTIDTTMAGLNTRVGTLETETDAVEERVTKLEAGEFERVNVSNGIFDTVQVNSIKVPQITTPSNTIIYSKVYNVISANGTWQMVGGAYATSGVTHTPINNVYLTPTIYESPFFKVDVPDVHTIIIKITQVESGTAVTGGRLDIYHGDTLLLTPTGATTKTYTTEELDLSKPFKAVVTKYANTNMYIRLGINISIPDIKYYI